MKWRVKQEIIPEASCLYIQLASACALSLRVVTGAEERQRERKSEEWEEGKIFFLLVLFRALKCRNFKDFFCSPFGLCVLREDERLGVFDTTQKCFYLLHTRSTRSRWMHGIRIQNSEVPNLTTSSEKDEKKVESARDTIAEPIDKLADYTSSQPRTFCWMPSDKWQKQII